MKQLIVLLPIILFNTDYIFAQEINKIFSKKTTEGTEILVERENGGQEIVCKMAMDTRIIDFIIISDTEFCQLLNMSGHFNYKKHYLNEEGFWRTKNSFPLGSNPISDLGILPKEMNFPSLEFKLLGIDNIIKITNGKDERVDLDKLANKNLMQN